MASRRVARVAERIRQEASQIILFELRDPRIGMVTVTKVDLTSDLRYATVYVSVFGDEAKRRTALRGLESARGLVQSRIAKSLNLREAPIISFQYDPTIEQAIEISRIIDEARAQSPATTPEGDEPNADAPTDDEPTGDEATGDELNGDALAPQQDPPAPDGDEPPPGP